MSTESLKVRGRVERRSVDTGSKSERNAVVLQTKGGSTYVLRKQGAPAFGDTTLDGLVGSDIVADGVRIGQTLIMKQWQRDE